jgi:hypothetical protein
MDGSIKVLKEGSAAADFFRGPSRSLEASACFDRPQRCLDKCGAERRDRWLVCAGPPWLQILAGRRIPAGRMCGRGGEGQGKWGREGGGRGGRGIGKGQGGKRNA